jgi:hypothetical protein
MTGTPFLRAIAVVPAPPCIQTAATRFSANNQSCGTSPVKFQMYRIKDQNDLEDALCNKSGRLT